MDGWMDGWSVGRTDGLITMDQQNKTLIKTSAKMSRSATPIETTIY